MNRKLTFWKLGLLASALVMLFSYSFADTIVSVTDSSTGTFPGGLFLGGQFSNVVATSWTQSASFSNVTIDALLGSHTSFQSGTAYLMSAIGPGTTPASEVAAPVDFTAPLFDSGGGAPIPPTVLFSGLTLAPGTYYLVLSAPFFDDQSGGSPLLWQVPPNPVYATAPSVTLGVAFDANTTLFPADSFPPASTFLFTEQPMYNVTGVPELPTVPEPSSLLLLGTGLLGIVDAVRRKLLR